MTTYPVNMDIKPEVHAFFDPATNTISYIVKDPTSNACAIVDSVMDIDYAAGRITYDHADELIRQIETQGLTLERIGLMLGGAHGMEVAHIHENEPPQSEASA